MSSLPMLLLAILGTFVASWLLTGRVLAYLRRRAILDHPNDRSSHSIPTPRGGGWGVMLTLLPAWALVALTTDGGLRVLPILIGAAALMAVSWMDDRRGLGPAPRFLAQIAAVAAGLTALPADGLVFQGLLPLWADRLVAAVGWLWFVNLFNFMDGIDGLAGSEAATIGAGLALVGAVGGLDPAYGLYGLAAAGAAMGFLVWNWHPAKLFMGDVGSVPLGFTLGWLLLAVAASGLWAAALLVPAYFLADATVTLLRRLVEGKKVWQAHREHFYQKATQRGRSHAQVVRLVLALNAALLTLAVVSVLLGPASGWTVLPAGAAAIVLLLALLARPMRAAA
ncbi:MraY family glycosyltransferase [Azospirillum rugosum]|uniref:UDP-N-acetylmuramyl pentapeptide phosphotransferase/UDP-N-acetylglucosamine-1-phosphate transferase n=1 Tax=Azospirillum rugosum TaxID=416170 RepID=A0ABS4SH44_9PROT|nr:glycosyltransferase family 4 protein [Azospirillum rugosum]MBP2291894.1 UDP-N-acetylmuramyl pentapeptide phosphotransferase/UDP-N-acetylglucosamine-1-phosphate transferase [Azospirillum rugosum]MDQ0530902.1 UDP-N-acetylmuramyl pentapeptide phosphotransferase/UDP-N-acetylglucosamine-1-phosphate transferase [Azospirillum rugosum]